MKEDAITSAKRTIGDLEAAIQVRHSPGTVVVLCVYELRAVHSFSTGSTCVYVSATHCFTVHRHVQTLRKRYPEQRGTIAHAGRTRRRALRSLRRRRRSSRRRSARRRPTSTRRRACARMGARTSRRRRRSSWTRCAARETARYGDGTSELTNLAQDRNSLEDILKHASTLLNLTVQSWKRYGTTVITVFSNMQIFRVIY